MKRILVFILAFILITFSTSAAWGTLAAGFGARAVGMGGAFTAVADDGSAPYWNPAGITQIKYVAFTPALGLEGKYDLSDELIKTDGDLPEFSENSFQLASMSYLGITSKYVAINGLIDLNATATTVSDKMTAIAESYGYGVLTVAGTFGEPLAVGVNLKTIQAMVVESKFDKSQTGYKRSAEGDGMAFDIGVLYRLSYRTKVGLIGRNIFGKVDWKDGTSEEYNMDNPTGIKNPWNPTQNIPKTYALGIAYNPYESLTLAADAEMIDATGEDNDQTRFHLGLEQRALWNSVAFRLGGYTNEDEKAAFTGGLGFKLWALLMDLAYVSGENTGYYMTAGLKF